MGNSSSRRGNSPSTQRPQSPDAARTSDQQHPPGYQHPPSGGYPGQYATPPLPNTAPPGVQYPIHPSMQYVYMANGGPYAPPPSQYYGQAPWPARNGAYYMGPRMPYQPAPVPPPIQPIPMQQPAGTTQIRNDVNLKKATLRLEKDEQNPGHWLVAFTFDASLPGSGSIFFMAREGEACSLTTTKPQLCKPFRFSFEKQLAHKYRQPRGTGIDLSKLDPKELCFKNGGPFAIAVRLEVVQKVPPADAPPRDETAGAKLPNWVQSQSTYAECEKKTDGSYAVKVLKQKIWVEGVSYELQEVYGIEGSAASTTPGAGESGDTGKECVICLTELRDTTVLPCRHLCLCNTCAKVFRYQTNRCPICRAPIESLMQMPSTNKSPQPSPLPQADGKGSFPPPSPPKPSSETRIEP